VHETKSADSIIAENIFEVINCALRKLYNLVWVKASKVLKIREPDPMSFGKQANVTII
jgi:hypothetical protein